MRNDLDDLPIARPARIQRKRTKGWRMPEGAVYVGRPTIFGNPWTLRDAVGYGIDPADRAAWLVRKYRGELEHGGLLSDYSATAGEAAWQRMADLMDSLDQEVGADGIQSVRPLFRHLLRNATALACWCPLGQPCHADALIEMLS